MVSEIRIYAEGGGDGKDTKARLRAGFNAFLNAPRQSARNRHINWSIIVCGSRNDAWKRFFGALEQHKTAWNVLLVDSESPVVDSAIQHLQRIDGWTTPGILEQQIHLMVQVMESWFVADVSTLRSFYGQGFNANAIPGTLDIESVDEDAIFDSLKSATRNTSKKEYHKIYHASKLLALIDSRTVRNRARHCEKLFTTLEQLLAE